MIETLGTEEILKEQTYLYRPHKGMNWEKWEKCSKTYVFRSAANNKYNYEWMKHNLTLNFEQIYDMVLG